MARQLIVVLLTGISALAAADPPAPCTGESHNFLVEVTSPGGEPENFEGVIAWQGELEVIKATTPYRLEFSAARLIAMFSSDTRITASLYVQNGDGTELVGYMTDLKPAIYESVSCKEPLLRAFGRY
ncbi:MAG TPA: hypothetical protein VHG33_01350 [Woeseiaceae bacterium]|nr:hypothetical protein [Woeseiaceae bacterium]